MRLRAERLGLADAPVELAAETSIEDIVATLGERNVPRLLIIDSIQTMWTDAVDSAPGTVTQVRASAQTLIRYAKRSGTAVILVEQHSETVLTLTQDAVVMERGAIVHRAPSRELLNDAATLDRLIGLKIEGA